MFELAGGLGRSLCSGPFNQDADILKSVSDAVEFARSQKNWLRKIRVALAPAEFPLARTAAKRIAELARGFQRCFWRIPRLRGWGRGGLGHLTVHIVTGYVDPLTLKRETTGLFHPCSFHVAAVRPAHGKHVGGLLTNEQRCQSAEPVQPRLGFARPVCIEQMARMSHRVPLLAGGLLHSVSSRGLSKFFAPFSQLGQLQKCQGVDCQSRGKVRVI